MQMGSILTSPLQKLLRPEGFVCRCGRNHTAWPLSYLNIGPGALERLPDALKRMNVKKPLIVVGKNGWAVAGARSASLLRRTGIDFSFFRFPDKRVILPDEQSLAEIEAAFDGSCDFILGIGSGVINDLCKMIACRHGLRAGIVATAPSMDGYASNSSAMELKGVKTTVYTLCPSLILCDTEIIRCAPLPMLRSGLGDMAAKIVSVADWRVAHLVTGEYYCGDIAQLMLRAGEEALNNAQAILRREELAVRRMTEGLVLSGIAMSFAGVSRPASGMEHTISHLLEMFALARGRQPSPHGIQVGYGLRIALKLYKEAYRFSPVPGNAGFDEPKWEADMRYAFGSQAEELILSAKREGRNSPEQINRRRDAICKQWDTIHDIIGGVLSQADRIEHALDLAEIPAICSPERMGYSLLEAKNAVRFSRDLRSRYIFTSMCFDMGLLSYDGDCIIDKLFHTESSADNTASVE